MFNPVVLYRYLLPTMYLFMADIANPDLFGCRCRTWICLDITRFKRSRASHSAGPHDGLAQKRYIWPHFWGRQGSTQFAQQFVTAVTAPPLVGCVVWSLYCSLCTLSAHITAVICWYGCHRNEPSTHPAVRNANHR